MFTYFLVAAGYKCDVRNWSTFILAFMRKFGVDMAVKYGHGGVLQLDATFATNRLEFPLFTIMVVDMHGNGIPVAWMLSSRSNTQCVAKFLQAFRARVRAWPKLCGASAWCVDWALGFEAIHAVAQVLKAKPDWEPRCFLVDADAAQLAAIRATFGINTKIYFCHYHMWKAWQAKINTLVCTVFSVL